MANEPDAGAHEAQTHSGPAQPQDQLRAMREVLRTLGRSTSSLDQVFDTVVESARDLAGGDVAQMHLLQGGIYELVAQSGLTQEFITFIAAHPIAEDRGTLIGRVGLDRRTQQIADVLADPDYGAADAQRIGNYRSIIGAPMLLDDEVIGVLSTWRVQVDPFSARDAEVLTDFAAQAAIAVRTARLVQDLEARGTELAIKVEQLEALGEVGAAVSSSLDLDEVLTTIVTHAVRLSGTDGGSILEFDPELSEFTMRAAYGTPPNVLEELGRLRVGLSDKLIGRAAVDRRPVQISDLTDQADDEHLRILRDGGWRSVTAVPMLRQDRIVGALVVRRRTPGEVDPETCEFLQTFASQSALALTNAQLFRRLAQQTAELEVVSRHKSEFLASMSHELRTPLNAIIGFSEVLLERMFGDLNDRQDEYLRDIHVSGKHLLALLNDILDLSKVEAGQMTLQPSTISLGPLLEGCVGLVAERALRHGLAIRVHVDDDVSDVQADELRLRQVVLNLLTNAVKFTPDGGTIAVAAANRADCVEITVTDTGVGIPPDEHQRIFDAFQQGGRSPRTTEGTGLGLTLSRRIVHLHGGDLWLISEVGGGSTFGFTLPAPEPATQPAARVPEAAPSPAARVLVVEDDRRSAELMTVLLEDQGLRVVQASTGERALKQLGTDPPDAVVLDLRLPGIDGFQVLDHIRSQPSTANLPVLVVSILDEKERAMTAGADGYLAKPFRRDDLLAALQRIALLDGQPTATRP